jgi:cystathionine beta-lyase
MDFDEPIDRRGTACAKWDLMDALYAVPPGRGIAMWVADMDFRPPPPVQRAVEAMAAHGVYGYPAGDGPARAAAALWLARRHGWAVDPDAMLTVHGLVNGTALCVDAFTEPGEGVLLFSPVYHAFARVIRAAGRRVVESPLARDGARYVMDLDDAARRLDPGVRLALLCSPHNPGGRVWSAAELAELAAFCDRHGLILVSDEIHHDLVYPPHRHTPTALAAPGIEPRLVAMTAATKTFNIAGAHTGTLIVPDPRLRARLAARIAGLGLSPGSFGLAMVTAAYSDGGEAWLADLIPYLDANRRRFDAALAAIPGAQSMPLEATYLAWVDFAPTGLAPAEVIDRVERRAGIAANHGESFGAGGEGFLRFNFALPRARLDEAAARLAAAFADLH